MPSPSAVFTEMVTTTDRSWSADVTDNVSNHNALLRKLKEKGNIKTFSGGYEIARPIEYAENSTYQRYAGYDQLNTNASDILSTVKFDLQQIALHVVSSGKEIKMNMSKERMVDLVKTKKANALRTGANQFSIDLYSSGALPNQIGGLANVIQTNGQGTVGGIDSTTWPMWRNRFREMTGTNLAASPTVANSASLKNDMNLLWMDLNRGADKPDLIVASHDVYALYEVGEQEHQRYASGDLANSGFQSMKYKGIDMVFDSNTNFATNAERMYFLNTNYLYIEQHAEAKWTPDEEKRPVNQDAVVVPIYWMGNLVVTRRAAQGILFDIA